MLQEDSLGQIACQLNVGFSDSGKTTKRTRSHGHGSTSDSIGDNFLISGPQKMR